MPVEKHKVVSIDYTLKDDEGDVIDSSEGESPLLYLHGVGGIIPGLESALDGKDVGDQVNVSIEPAQGYGERRDELQQIIPREQFAEVEDLDVGMQFQASAESGDPIVVTVVEVGDDTVTVDGNHQLAGMTLHFDVTIREIRDATADELSHGHAHGPDGHC